MRFFVLIIITLSLQMDTRAIASVPAEETAGLSEGVVYWFTGCTVDYDNDFEWCFA